MDAGPPPCLGGVAVDCRDQVAIACEGEGVPGAQTDCGATGEVCVVDLGCRFCAPLAVTCEDNVFRRCGAEGTAFDQELACDAAAGEFCSAAGCADLCAAAAESESYVGCDYWAVPAINDESLLPDPLSRRLDAPAPPNWPGFDYALVVANTELVPAEVRVAHPQHPAGPFTIAPGSIEVIRLAWIDALQFPLDGDRESDWRSRVAPRGAYHVTANVPVTVYQFNPLEFSKDFGGRRRFSFTNDASLLLPTHVLTGEYLTVARPTLLLERPVRVGDTLEVQRGRSPGFVTVVPVGDGDTEVEIRAAGHIAGTGDDRLPPLAPGESATVSLGRGDVLELLSGLPDDCPEWVPEPVDDTGLFRYCRLGGDWDLTGTEIRATGPVAVLAGHQCAFAPFDRFACDHLEESQFPVQTWGREVLVPAPQPVRGEPYLVRVLSATDGNEIRFDPEIAPSRTLDAGAFFEVEARGDLVVTADDPVAVATFLVGQDYGGLASSGPNAVGDPSMGFGIPREQLRQRYAFLAPETFTESGVTILAPPGTAVTLDGVRLSLDGATPVGGSGLVGLRLRVAGGAHELEADRLVALVVYGYAEYTSYLLPGGLDFEDLGLLR